MLLHWVLRPHGILKDTEVRFTFLLGIYICLSINIVYNSTI